MNFKELQEDINEAHKIAEIVSETQPVWSARLKRLAEAAENYLLDIPNEE